MIRNIHSYEQKFLKSNKENFFIKTLKVVQFLDGMRSRRIQTCQMKELIKVRTLQTIELVELWNRQTNELAEPNLT